MLKLEVGKYYSNRAGYTVKIDAHDCDIYPFKGTSPDYEYVMSFTEDGRHYRGLRESGYDLVAEIPDPLSLPTQGLKPLSSTVAGQMHFIESVGGRFPDPPEMCIDHLAVDTGMTNSWCKHCDINMEFNRDTGKYRVKV